MKKVIDVRDMHTAIHSLYLVTRKPKTTLGYFQELEYGDFWQDDNYCDYTVEYYYNKINENTEYLGEINFRDVTGGQVTRKGIPVDSCVYDNGQDKYQVIGRFD